MIFCSLIILHLFYNQKVDAIELKKVSMSVLREYQSWSWNDQRGDFEEILSSCAHLNSDNWTTGISLRGEWDGGQGDWQPAQNKKGEAWAMIVDKVNKLNTDKVNKLNMDKVRNYQIHCW